MYKKIAIIFALLAFFSINNDIIAKKGENKGKGSEKRSEKSVENKGKSDENMGKSEEKANKAKSEDAKKNWGLLKEDSYDSKEDRELHKLEINHMKQLRMIVDKGDLDYDIDDPEEFSQFLDDWYGGLIELDPELETRLEEEFERYSDGVNRILAGEYDDDEDLDDDEPEEEEEE